MIMQGDVVRWFRNSILESFHLNFWYTHNASPVMHFSSTYHTTPTQMYALSATAVRVSIRDLDSGTEHNILAPLCLLAGCNGAEAQLRERLAVLR